MTWSVFLKDEILPLPAQAIAKMLCETVKGVIFDHVQRIHIHHGWVARGLEEPQAGRLVELLRAIKDDKDFLFFNRWIAEKTVP